MLSSKQVVARGFAMPVHDWTRVEAGIFHDFHHGWIEEIKRALNRGLLPADYYALAEQIAGGLGPDVLSLQRPAADVPPSESRGGVALAEAPPKVRFHCKPESSRYAARAKSVVVHHCSNHRVVARVEIVSPGNKNTRNWLRAFVNKAGELLQAGIHLLILDLFPPSERDPEGIHPLIWDHSDDAFTFSAEKPLTLASYIGGPCGEAFVEPVAVHDSLPDMPLFLTPERYVSVPLEAIYQSAWEAFPAYWRGVLMAPPAS
jgi:hypothetical protein